MTQEVLKLGRGEWLLQTAASSSLGRMIIRLGRQMGFRTLNVVRRADHVAALKSLGADSVVVFDGASDSPEKLRTAIREAPSACNHKGNRCCQWGNWFRRCAMPRRSGISSSMALSATNHCSFLHAHS